MAMNNYRLPKNVYVKTSVIAGVIYTCYIAKTPSHVTSMGTINIVIHETTNNFQLTSQYDTWPPPEVTKLSAKTTRLEKLGSSRCTENWLWFISWACNVNVVITSVITQIVMFKQRLKKSLSGEGNVRRLHRFSLWKRKCATFTQILSLEKEMCDVYTDSLSGEENARRLYSRCELNYYVVEPPCFILKRFKVSSFD